MVKDYRNTLSAHAWVLSTIATGYTGLASAHRIAASLLQRRQRHSLSYESHFEDWIQQACELSAAADRLLALEIELARDYGVSWGEIASALGVSRQSAWERYARHKTWEKSRRIAQVRRVYAARAARDQIALWRNRQELSEDEIEVRKEWLQRTWTDGSMRPED